MYNVINQIILIFTSIFYHPIITKILNPLFQIFIIILVLYWILKKLNLLRQKNNVSNIKILSYISVGPNEKIIIVDCKKVKLVLGVTSYCINFLYKIPSSFNEERELLKKDNIK